MPRSHIERLGDFRDILVATRREGIRNVHHTRAAMQAGGFQIGESDGSSYGAELKALQDQIEAVDRAIEDEKRFAVEDESSAQSRRPIKPRSARRTGAAIGGKPAVKPKKRAG